MSTKNKLRVVVYSILLFFIGLKIYDHYFPPPPLKISAGIKKAPPSMTEAGLEPLLRADLQKLAGDIGERNLSKYQNLVAAAEFLEKSFREMGYEPQKQSYKVDNLVCDNLEVEIKGGKKKDEIIIIGGHYDSVTGCPGANDNGTGAVAVLELARAFRSKNPERTIRFVEFVNEEPPYFQNQSMGSVVYAKRCKERKEKIVAMLSLETMGYYSDEEGSQKYPPFIKHFYPSKGNYVGFITNQDNKSLLDLCKLSFQKHSDFPIQGAALWETIPGIGWSDHWSFWEQGYPGIMITDTAIFRYPHYHTDQDTPDKIDYPRFAKVVCGLEAVLIDLAEVKAVP